MSVERSVLEYQFSHSFDVEIAAQEKTAFRYSWKKEKPEGIPPGLVDTGTLEN